MRKMVLFTFVLAVTIFAFGNQAGAQDAQPPKDTKKQGQQPTRDAKMEAKTGAQTMAGGSPMMVTLTGAAEVPGPGDTDGSGTASITLNHDKGEVCYDITVKDIAKPTAAHIHTGAVGTSGGVKVPFKASADGTWKGCATADKAVIKEIMDNPANFYVNVHNDEFKAGAVRGQLGAKSTQ